MNSDCLICGNPTSLFLREQGYNFNKCPNCQFFFVNPMPTDEELSRVYSPNVGYQAHKTKKDYTKEVNTKYLKIFSELKKHTKPDQRVLDVGTSDGEFLYYARNNGYEVAGVEPNKTTADIANKNGLNVFLGFLRDAPFPKNSFDVIRLGDVLEHSNSPQKLLNDCKEFLKKNGFLIISIPNMDSPWAKSTYLLKKFFSLPWSVITPPHHLLYFSKNNLDLFLEQNGFSLVITWYHRPPNLKYELGSTHLFGQFKREKNFKSLVRLIFGFGLYSLLYTLNYLITPFKKKDFGMLCIYKKNA